MLQISKNTQVIAITHNHQVACMAQDHIHIHKENNGEKAITTVRHLSQEERVEEIANMMSSSEDQHHMKEVARKMISGD